MQAPTAYKVVLETTVSTTEATITPLMATITTEEAAGNDTTALVDQLNDLRETRDHALELICIIDQGKAEGHVRYLEGEIGYYQGELDQANDDMVDLVWDKYTTDVNYECINSLSSDTVVSALKTAKFNEVDVGPALDLAQTAYERAQAVCDDIDAKIAAINARYTDPNNLISFW